MEVCVTECMILATPLSKHAPQYIHITLSDAIIELFEKFSELLYNRRAAGGDWVG